MQVTPFYNGGAHLEYGIYFKTGSDSSSVYGANFIIIYVPSQTLFSLTYNGTEEGRDGAAGLTIIQLRRTT